eukprot:CAMPEP_0176413294 /NCGR_PEP_ID=MMETSP0127-20121128/4622_1 /TAXON_ID=938130 /ORGANISM="Platyophrya macrostoma, Strain WH" /LENGTH=380 /DNA_ID=CAMNT_0017793065 /DNA_START=255 /DNA_END=1398 /DNA_ORIENTATION=+
MKIPGVSDLVEWSGSSGVITNSNNTVIQVSSAPPSAVENTSPVQLEVHGRSSNSNGDWLLGKGSLESSRAVLSDILETADWCLSGETSLAGTISSGVWVSIFGGETSNRFNVGEKKFDESGLKGKLESALHICISNNKYDDPDSEVLWFFLLDKLLDLYKEYEVGSKYIRIVFDKMSLYVALDSIIERIERNYGEVFLGVLKKSLVDMLSNYHYESDIMKNARILDMDDTTELLLQTNILSMKGAYLEKMPEAAAVGQLAIFECGHTFPNNYITPAVEGKWDSYECPICSKLDNNKILKFCWNFKPGATVSGAKAKNAQAEQKSSQGGSKDQNVNVAAGQQNKLSKGDSKRQVLRKLRLYDQKKEDETYYVDRYKERYDF